MVDITPPVQQGRQLISRYGDGAFFIGEEEYFGAVLVSPEQTCLLPIASPDDLTADMLTAALEAIPDDGAVLLFGMGETIKPVEKSLRQSLRAANLSVEPMDTGAACRTFNVLLSEDRAVFAVLIPVP